MKKRQVPEYDASRDLKGMQNDISALQKNAQGSQLYNYTVTWAGSGATQPAIGNGELLGTYRRDGIMCWMSVVLRFGSTTTAGSVSTFWTFSLPFQASTFPDSYTGSAVIHDDSVATDFRTGSTLFWDPTANTFIVITGNLAIGGNTPYTWAVNDFMVATLYYPCTN